ncbi:MAG: pro-sigmaK processing inhibitor BofA family protein [Oscillospiraceae bacterium]
MESIMLFLGGFIVLAAVSYALARAQRPILTAVKSAVCGIGSLMLVNIVSKVTGCYIGVNFFTAFVAGVLSVPGVIAMLFLKLIFI